MTISTQRFIGHPPELSHLDHYATMLNDPVFIKCYGVFYDYEKAQERLEADIQHWKDYNFGPWMWFDKTNQNYVGRAGLRNLILDNKKEIELAYAIRPEYWGKGVAVELGQTALDYGFNQVNLKNIICFTLTTNIQSQRVMEKLGFQYKKDFIYKDRPHKLYRLENK